MLQLIKRHIQNNNGNGKNKNGTSVNLVAANAPRRYVSLAGREGRGEVERLFQASNNVNSKTEFDELHYTSQFLPPMPWNHPSDEYMQRLEDELNSAFDRDQNNNSDSSYDSNKDNTKPDTSCPYIGFNSRTMKFIDAQSLWDASMGFSIAQALSNNDEESRLVIHVCGQVWKKRIDNNNNASRRKANIRSEDQNKVTSSMKLDVFCYSLRNN